MLGNGGLALAGCALGSLLGAFEAEAAPVNRAGAITKFDGVHEIVEACTTSTTFVNIPGMTRAFSQGGTAADEVMFCSRRLRRSAALTLTPGSSG